MPSLKAATNFRLVQLNQLSYMAQFTTDVRHVSGTDNIPADALSRVDAVTAPIGYVILAAAQVEDEVLSQLLRDSNSLRLECVRTSNADTVY